MARKQKQIQKQTQVQKTRKSKGNSGSFSGLKAMIDDNMRYGMVKAIAENKLEMGTLTRKQFYSRLAALKRHGLIHRLSGIGYVLTSYGETLFKYLQTMEQLETQKFRFAAIDAMKLNKKISKSEIDNITQAIFADNKTLINLVQTPTAR